MNKSYNIIIPIGHSCTLSFHLKNNSLRYCSLPFDWIWGVTLEKAIYFIENSFNGFFVKEKLQFQRICGIHNAYRQEDIGINFVHDIPKDLDFNSGYAVAREKYNRRIQRLYDKLETCQKILFIFFDDRLLPLNKKEIIKNFNKLKALCAYKNADLMYVYIDKNKTGKNEFLTKNITLIPMTIPENLSEDMRWMADTKQFEQIFSTIKIEEIKTKKFWINITKYFAKKKKVKMTDFYD